MYLAAIFLRIFFQLQLQAELSLHMWLELTHQALSWPCTESEHQVQGQNLKHLSQLHPLLHSERKPKIQHISPLLSPTEEKVFRKNSSNTHCLHMEKAQKSEGIKSKSPSRAELQREHVFLPLPLWTNPWLLEEV